MNLVKSLVFKELWLSHAFILFEDILVIFFSWECEILVFMLKLSSLNLFVFNWFTDLLIGVKVEDLTVLIDIKLDLHFEISAFNLQD